MSQSTYNCVTIRHDDPNHKLQLGLIALAARDADLHQAESADDFTLLDPNAAMITWESNYSDTEFDVKRLSETLGSDYVVLWNESSSECDEPYDDTATWRNGQQDLVLSTTTRSVSDALTTFNLTDPIIVAAILTALTPKEA